MLFPIDSITIISMIGLFLAFAIPVAIIAWIVAKVRASDAKQSNDEGTVVASEIKIVP